MGFVFQHYALFRHMTVFDNVAFGSRRPTAQDAPHRERDQAQGNQLFELVQLDWAGDRFPAQPPVDSGSASPRPRVGRRAAGAAAGRAVRRADAKGAGSFAAGCAACYR